MVWKPSLATILAATVVAAVPPPAGATAGTLLPCTADFTWTPASPLVGEAVQFTDASQGDITGWMWDFGDGGFSTERNPVYIYDRPGTYTVTLDLTGPTGAGGCTTSRTLTVLEAATPDFTWSPVRPVPGETVQFTDRSVPDPQAWSWDFGDGSFSDLANPAHAYNAPGLYDVALTVTWPDGTSATVIQTLEVVASTRSLDFSWSPLEPLPGDTVTFTGDASEAPAAWDWSFGDGTGASGRQATHVYDTPGRYDVTLTATWQDGTTDTVVHTVTVLSGAAPYVDFSWQPADPAVGEAVEFLGESDREPAAWRWSFGDGTGGSGQFPVHVYDQPGTYTVSLTAEFDDGTTAPVTVEHQVSVAPERLQADFLVMPRTPIVGQPAQFLDVSRGGPETWYWEFGDGTVSDQPEPVHVYAQTGEYTVTLRVTRGADTSAVTRTVRVIEPPAIDFTWDPERPEPFQPVSFTPEVPETLPNLLWYFGDDTDSLERAPVHVWREPGAYVVSLWAWNDDTGVTAYAEHVVTVTPPAVDVGLEVSNPQPSLGEPVLVRITGLGAVDGTTWEMGGPPCDEAPVVVECVPTTGEDCLSRWYRYATPGRKVVRVWVWYQDAQLGPFTASIRVRREGGCGEPPVASFEVWPQPVAVGETVRFADTSAGGPSEWAWDFGDGTRSVLPSPSHRYSLPGTYTVRLTVRNAAGEDTVERTIQVDPAPTAACGDGICSEAESAWSCPADCGPGAGATGLGGASGNRAGIPAVAGGIPGEAGTFWLTEGTVFNPAGRPANVVFELITGGGEGGRTATVPVHVPPRTALYSPNLVEELFGTRALGSLWIDSDAPVIVTTRTFNTGTGGTLGQGIRALRRRESLGEGEGAVLLPGLASTVRFRTNLIVQEINGQPATVHLAFVTGRGRLVATHALDLPGYGRVHRPIAMLGAPAGFTGYALLKVTGAGRVVVIGSVVDQRTGDATTVAAIHPRQAGPPAAAKAADGEAPPLHSLVAVVAHTPGANDTVWRSELVLLNPSETAQRATIQYVPARGTVHSAEVTLDPLGQFTTDDVVGDLFPDVPDGTGALHVLSDGPLVVTSRTYNLLPDGSTVGQAIPGLREGDMIRPGEIWVLEGIRENDEYRCNLGFAEYEGSDAEVSVVLFDASAGALRFLASKKYTVPAYSQVQVNRVFQDMGIPSASTEAVAYVTVSGEQGAVYAYASVVDNGTGDATTVLAKRAGTAGSGGGQ